MAAKRHDRTLARRSALQVLYAGEINEASPSQMVDEGLILQDETKLNNYATSLVYGVDSHRMSIDRALGAVSDNWALDRMSVVDRSILRLAVYEMLYVDTVPVSVTINEAVELAKDFGGEEDSSRFVNGVLGRLAKLLEEGKLNLDGSIVTDEAEAAEPELPASSEADDPLSSDSAEEASAELDGDAPAEVVAADEAEEAGVSVSAADGATGE